MLVTLANVLSYVTSQACFEHMMTTAYSLTQVWLSFYGFRFVGESFNDMFQKQYLSFM